MLLMVLCRLSSDAHSAESFDGQTFYFGDLHSHTGISPDGWSTDVGNTCPDNDPLDGVYPCGSVEGAFDAARDTYNLDFVSFTDHATPTTDPDLFNAFLQRGLDETSDTFVVIPGAERILFYTDGSNVGHKTNLVLQDDVDILATLDLGDFAGDSYGQDKKFDTCDEVWDHPEAMEADFGPTLEFAHHPATELPMWNDWTCHDQTYEPVVEVYSGFGNSLRVDDYDQPLFPVPGAFVHEALETYGLRVGFVGGTDLHFTLPGAVCVIQSSATSARPHIYGGGLTVVALPDGGDFKRSTIYDELAARRSLVTTGPEMPVSVHWITPDGVTHAIGEELVVHDTDAESTTLSVKIPTSPDSATDWNSFVLGVRAVGYATTFDLTEQAEGEWSVAIPNDQLPTWLYADVAIDGAAYYGAPGACADSYPMDADGTIDVDFGTVDDREFVWSSPAWFDPGTDLDGDTYAYDVDDCNDYDAAIAPDADEIWYDGVDQNCDGNDMDQDWDGFAWDVDDCDDLDAAIYPGAPEIPGNGIDEDCDGVDGAGDVDLDGDGYTSGAGDCDDSDAAINPDADEVWYDGVDQNCDGNDMDQDWDSFDFDVDDCDDLDAAIYPGAPEIPNNGIDEDCDGVDSGDLDGDGFTSETGDCDDSDAAINPDAVEVWYDGIDQNCDGNDFDQDWDAFDYADDCDDLDDAINPDADEVWYDGIDQNCDGNDLDQDWDGFDVDVDCDDTDDTRYPGATEILHNGIDENCDGVDSDADGDGYVSPSDCNDSNAGIHPGARDIPNNGIDEDCNGRDRKTRRH